MEDKVCPTCGATDFTEMSWKNQHTKWEWVQGPPPLTEACYMCFHGITPEDLLKNIRLRGANE